MVFVEVGISYNINDEIASEQFEPKEHRMAHGTYVLIGDILFAKKHLP